MNIFFFLSFCFSAANLVRTRCNPVANCSQRDFFRDRFSVLPLKGKGFRITPLVQVVQKPRSL